MSLKKALLGAVLVSGLAPSHADAATYNWTISCDIGAVCTGSGSLITSSAVGPTTVTSMTGTMLLQAVSLLSVGTFLSNDNQLVSLIDPELTTSGISFSTASYDFNIRWSGIIGDLLVIRPTGPIFGTEYGATFRITSAVPVPAALPLLATGLGALGVIGWRRKRKLAQAQT